MTRTASAVILSFLIPGLLPAQETDSTTGSLPEIRIQAFSQDKRLKDLPTSINYVNREALERFNATSIVHAINTTPGVKMEERSPGSYRMNIRGSSLRSPFGVRNVKLYYNDIPFTDPGGHSYLNLLGYYNFQSVEIIKGPGSSLYGAGTGGVMIINSINPQEKTGIKTFYSAGGYQLHNIYASISSHTDKMNSSVGFQHQQQKGYRNHSELKRNIFNWTTDITINEKNELKSTVLLGEVFYETPGALTRTEYESNPKAARPATGSFPGAKEARASVNQKSFLAGISYLQKLGEDFENRTVLYGMFTELRNPAIRNYARSSEPHYGGRTMFSYSKNTYGIDLKWQIGGEWQEGLASTSIHNNRQGQPDSLQSLDEIKNIQQYAFTQLSFEKKNWFLLGGLSVNQMKLRFQRFTPLTSGVFQRKFGIRLSPRIALMKKINSDHATLNIYSGISGGFSPPTSSELLPTGSAINLDLQAEQGTNYDLGFKLNIQERWYIDVNAFWFGLKNTIVQRRDAGGGDFFINAGETRQHGIETYMSYDIRMKNRNKCMVWLSHTWHDFNYRSFIQLNQDFSGNQLPSVAPRVIASGIDLKFANGFQTGITYYYNDRIALNDANSEFANSFHLLGLKTGFRKSWDQHWNIIVNAGIENILDEDYSLGNDINGFGGRYYNAAPGRNYFISIAAELNQ